jgi:hypothetical protein
MLRIVGGKDEKLKKRRSRRPFLYIGVIVLKKQNFRKIYYNQNILTQY